MRQSRVTPSAVMWGIFLPATLLCLFTRVCWPLAVKSLHSGGKSLPLNWLRSARIYQQEEINGWRAIAPRLRDLWLAPVLLLVFGLCAFYCVVAWA